VCTFSLLLFSFGSKEQTDSKKLKILGANFEALTAALMILGFRKTWHPLGFIAGKFCGVSFQKLWSNTLSYYEYGKAIPRQVGLKYVGRHLLDTDEGCKWRQIPANDIRLYILQESFCLFHEHVKYYFAHLNFSVSLKICLIEKLCIHIWFNIKNAAKFTYWSSWDKKWLNFVEQCYQ
jgi:hypothetical protein